MMLTYEQWLERKLLLYEPVDIICESSGMAGSNWCYERCEYSSPVSECLRRAYEIETENEVVTV